MVAAQFPAPSQVAAGLKVLPEQLACWHPVLVDHGLQAPLPLQVPSFEQSPAAALLATHRCLGSGPPPRTGEQVPTFPDTLQLIHKPPWAAAPQAESQHTPSVQMPVPQSAPTVQTAPFGLSPHALFTHVLGATQSLSRLQLDRQAEPLQTKVPHDTSGGVTQRP